VPHAYEEAGKAQFHGMPGVVWVRDSQSPNGRGFYRGPRDAVEIVCATLERVGVVKLLREAGPLDGLLGHLITNERLRDYQRTGAEWLAHAMATDGGGLLADEMGLGKTPQAIAACDAQGDARTLVICPAVVVPHWGDELVKWAQEPSLWEVRSYEMAAKGMKRGSARELAGFARVVVDEGHYYSNPKAQRTKAAREWLAAQPKRPAVAVLSGTPMTAKPSDLWSPLDLMHPGRWGTWWLFTKRYCNGRYEEIPNVGRSAWVFDGLSHQDELRTRIASVMLRRTKLQVGASLPPRTRQVVEVAIPASARAGLRAAAIAIDGGEGIAALLKEAEGHKLDHAEALARDVLACGGRPLILTLRRRSARELGKRLNAPSVTGEDEATTRRALIADAPCAVATLHSVTTGINLTGFDCVIFVGLDWIPSRMLQGEARIHRIGQDKPCTIYYLCAKGTLDEIIRERVIERLDNEAAVLGDGSDGLRGAMAPDSEDDLIAAIVAASQRKKAA
jgi:SWI/SNF-related matrix-associated actin-dependent regulator of chromatin subfamily A-like protein 1